MAETAFKKRAAYLAHTLPELNKRIRARVAPPAKFIIGGLTIGQVLVLQYLADHHSATMTELATWANVALPTMTVTIQRLVKLGRVERVHDAQDRRVVKIQMTRQGKRECANYQAGVQDALEVLLATLKPQAQVQLEKALRVLEAIFT
jgi:DNA-binding MarR family transcriptional regulator